MAQLPIQLPGVCEDARRLARFAIEGRRDSLYLFLQVCESPIEELLAVAMWDYWSCRATGAPPTLETLITVSGSVPRLVVEPQRDLATPAGLYRADFFDSLRSIAELGAGSTRWAPTVVEVDGYPFHEKTREQATRDRQRDRAMLLEGVRVVRFSGRTPSRPPPRAPSRGVPLP